MGKRKKEKSLIKRLKLQNILKTIQKIDNYEIPPNEINRMLRVQVQKYGVKLNLKKINTPIPYDDKNGRSINKKRRH